MTLYMEQYLDTLQLLPGDLQRKLRLLRDLDQKSHKHMETGDRLSNAFITSIANLGKEERKKRYEEIHSHYGKAKTLGDEKVQLAMQTYEMVDKHIRRLDAELAKFESELKRNMLKQEEQQQSSAGETGKKSRKSLHESPGKKRKSVGVDEGAKVLKTRRKTTDTVEFKTPKMDLEPQALDTSDGFGFMQQLASIGADVLDMPIDPNEPVYCVCRQVSYGQMIGCDNPDCPIEWFHFNCVGLTTKPKGKWFCQRCTEEKKRNKN